MVHPKKSGCGLHQFSNKIGVYHTGYGFKVYPYIKEGTNGLEVHRNRHTNIRYTQDSKLTNFWYMKERTAETRYTKKHTK